jgi:hypothetical protein
MEGLSARTIEKRIQCLRWWAELLGKADTNWTQEDAHVTAEQEAAVDPNLAAEFVHARKGCTEQIPCYLLIPNSVSGEQREAAQQLLDYLAPVAAAAPAPARASDPAFTVEAGAGVETLTRIGEPGDPGTISLSAWALEPPGHGQVWGEGKGKSYLIPAADIIGFEFLLNMFNRHYNAEDVYGSDWSSIHRNLHSGWIIDNDPFATNQFLHPYQGSMYHGFARSAGLSYWESAAYTFAASAAWRRTGGCSMPRCAASRKASA